MEMVSLIESLINQTRSISNSTTRPELVDLLRKNSQGSRDIVPLVSECLATTPGPALPPRASELDMYAPTRRGTYTLRQYAQTHDGIERV
jgi:hypothetical protein